jgi:hypothetical protein
MWPIPIGYRYDIWKTHSDASFLRQILQQVSKQEVNVFDEITRSFVGSNPT